MTQKIAPLRILRNDESDTGDVTSPQCKATSPEIDDYMDWMDDVISTNDTPAQKQAQQNEYIEKFFYTYQKQRRKAIN